MGQAQKFFVGIGVQKAGTTWLADYLASHPQVALPPFKEAHYWTSKYSTFIPGAVRSKDTVKVRIPAMVRWMAQGVRRAPALSLKRGFAFVGYLLHRDRSYRRLLELSGPDADWVGEVTPAYATLDRAAFDQMDACLDRPHYILMLRNPADRFISQMGMDGRFDPAVLQADPVADLALRPGFAARSDYASVLEICAGIAPQARVLTLFYEHLFDAERGQAEQDRVCAFLNIAPHVGDRGKKMNPRWGAKPEVDRAAIVRLLRPQYEAVEARFGTDLPASWQRDLAWLRGR